ncbi:hypothetical protein [Rathayibacter sp. PhB151]|uniref:hypothetical protein n=1 Tax=Rathayibacter sp. PhB151 TaxID=2485189 RepID=UPI001062916A|nr:hypothetical protein [Rathayibacter sp. PhB151]
MPEPERWIRIDAAAAGLGVSIRQAYLIAQTDCWAKTGGRPAKFALSDVRATHARRKAEREARGESDDADPDRAGEADRRLLVSA